MNPVMPTFPCPIEDLVPSARQLRLSYVRDQPAFVKLLPKVYTVDFLKEYDQRFDAADKLVRALVQRAKGMLFTAHIQELYKEMPELFNYLEARVRRVPNLTVGAKKFGIGPARVGRNTDNHSALEDALKTLLQNMADNATGLAEQGQTPEDTQKLQAVYDALVEDTTKHGQSMSIQKNLSQDNLKVLNSLFEWMQHLLADGKSLYGASNRAKAQDYTMVQILKKVGRARAAAAPAPVPTPPPAG